MTTYTISLDDVELALLPPTRRLNDFLKKEYFEFQVLKKDAVEEPPNIFYTCHICAIAVPAAFGREHASSVKHRACARIARVAARRMRALVSAPPPPCAHAPVGRFCANCATVVDGDHDTTDEHNLAVARDRLLWDLMKAYAGDADDDGNGANDVELDVLNGLGDDITKNGDIANDEKEIGINRVANRNLGEDSSAELADGGTETVPCFETIKTEDEKNIKHKADEINFFLLGTKNIIDNRDQSTEEASYLLFDSPFCDFNETIKSEDEKNEREINDSALNDTKKIIDDKYVKHNQNKLKSNDVSTDTATYYLIDSTCSELVDCSKTDDEQSMKEIEDCALNDTKKISDGKDVKLNINKAKTDNGSTKTATYLFIDATFSKFVESIQTEDVKNIMHKEEITTNAVDGKDAKHDIKEPEIGNVNIKETEYLSNSKNKIVVPKASRWFQTHAKAGAILNEPIPTKADIARRLLNKHANESYIEILRKIVGTDVCVGVKEVGDLIQIKKNYEIFQVPVDNFHSYVHNTKYNLIRCIACKTSFQIEYKEVHKYEIGHMNHVVKIGDDSNCMRRVKFVFSHCILCNMKIKKKKIVSHVTLKRHIKNKKELLLP